MDMSPAGRRSAVEAALLDYQRTPGKFALLKREPVVLFGSIKDVLQIAAGRAPEGDEARVPSAQLRQAACFFMRGAMLHQSADHYALLGVDRKASIDAIKDQYRLMMRLMHPDFALQEGGTEWPPDTASRVNRAYETLSSAESRATYDAGLAAPLAALSPAPPSTSQAMRAAAEAPAPADPRGRLKLIAAAMGALGVVFLGTFLLGSSDRESLVQRQDGAAELVADNVSQAKALPDAGAPPKSATRVPESLPAAPVPAMVPEPVSVATTHKPDSVLSVLPPVSAQLDQAQPFTAMNASPTRTPSQAATSPTLKLSTAVSSFQVQRSPSPVPASRPAEGAMLQQPATTPAQPVSTPVALVEPPSVQAAPARPNPGVTMAQVHPMLADLVQQVESGTGDRLLAMLDRDARRAPSAQALVRQYNTMVDGGSVKVSHVQFRTEPQDGRLVVTGYLIMEVGTSSGSPTGKELVLQAEFVSRNGVPVMTGLSRAGNGRAQ